MAPWWTEKTGEIHERFREIANQPSETGCGTVQLSAETRGES